MHHTRLRRRRVLTSLALACALLTAGAAAADTWAWLALQRRIARRLDDTAGGTGPLAWHLEAASRTRGGWPFAATVRLKAASITAPIGHDSLHWSAQQATLSIALLHPRTMTVRVRGIQSLGTGNSGDTMRLRVQGETLTLRLPASGSRTRAIVFAMAGGRGGLTLPGLQARFRFEALRGTWRRAGAANALSLTIHTLATHEAATRAQEAHSRANLSLEASLAPTAVAGRDGGDGIRLLVSHATLGWPDATLEASGDASLVSPAASPAGQFSLRIRNAPWLLARLVADGEVTPSTGTAIQAVLGLIAAGAVPAPHEAAGAGDITLPITLAAGMVRLGEIPLLRLPDFSAPAADDARRTP